MEPRGSDEEDGRPRSSSNASSHGSEDWILLNASGSEMENCSSQTVPEVDPTEQNSLMTDQCPSIIPSTEKPIRSESRNSSGGETGDSYDLLSGSGAPSVEDEQESLCKDPEGGNNESCLDSSSSTVLEEEKVKEETDAGQSDTPSSDDMSILDESELMDDIRQHRKNIDPEKVARLLDALAIKSVNKKPPVDELRSEDGAVPSVADNGDYYCGDLPVNFVQMCSNRIRNYIHTANNRLNWKLSLLLMIATATVLGLGFGHFVGTTHSWLKKRRIAKEQVEQLKVIQDELVSCLGKQELSQNAYQTELGDLRRQVAGCRQLESHCSAHDKPNCDKDIASSVSHCQMKLKICDQKLESAESEVTRKATVNNWALARMRELQKNMTLHTVKADRFMSARLAQRRAERRMSVFQKRLQKKDKRVENLEGTLEQLKSELIDVTEGMRKLREQNYDLSQERLSLKAMLRDVTEKLEVQEESCEERMKEQEEDVSWKGVTDFFDRLKKSGNFTETVRAYLTIVKNLDFAQYMSHFANASDQYAEEQLNQFRDVLRNLQEFTVKKLKDLKSLADSASLHEYMDGAEILTHKVTTALSEVWDKTKDIASNVHREQGKKVKDFLGEFDKHLNDVVEEVSPKVHETWTALANQFRDMISTISGKRSNPSFDDEENDTGETDGGDHCVEDEIVGDLTEEEEEEEEEGGTPVLIPRDVTPEEAVVQMYEFRYALKRSSLEVEIGEEMADRYLDHLKYLGKRQGLGKSSFNWWKCQKEWWTGNEASVCLGELWKWQRQYDVVPAVFLARNLIVNECANSWTDIPIVLMKDDSSAEEDEGFEEENQCSEGEEDRKEAKVVDGSWLFERSSFRAKIRTNEAKSDWIFDRSRNRDRQRKDQEEGYQRSEWIFRRGKERASRREDGEQEAYIHGKKHWNQHWNFHYGHGRKHKRNENQDSFRRARASAAVHW